MADILDGNSSRYFEVFFAAAKIDCATVGVNARLAAPEVLFILEDSTAAVLFVGREHYALIESIETQLTTAPLIIALEGGHARWPALRDWCESQPAQDPRMELHDDSDDIQLYTSGTTGNPKGVCHTNRSWRLLAQAGRAARWGDYGHETVTLVCLPLFHVAGFNLSCLALLGGGTALLTRKLDVEEVLRSIPRHRVTDTLFVPAVILAVLSHPQAAGTDFSSLRCISYGAAPIAEDLLQRARAMFDCAFVMKIVDAQGRDLPAGEVGEILLRSDWTMRGYWRNDAATAATLSDRWLHTGDAGYLDADGYLYIHDRIKDMTVIGVPDEKWGEAVKALLVLKPGTALDVEAILDFARRRIAGYKLPKSIDGRIAAQCQRQGAAARAARTLLAWAGTPRFLNCDT